ncbi:hypothetical protein ABIC55_001673 [Sporosarcina psychrophila]|uniref:Uncharacterized protein n=1 Tax=Sporosarcina psychrophila TaxID=1476 RepID=A0ABV2K698_SPOPS|nr:hypothetical protein AZE41_09310 [Sporosarcina psychrophila]
MKNGRNSGLIYWRLNYRKKFIRTLWMIPPSIILIIMLLISEISDSLKIVLTLALIVTLPIQLFYTHYKWKSDIEFKK